MLSRKPVILVIDDNKKFLESLNAIISKFMPDCVVKAYTDPFKAVANAKTVQPDVLIIDFLIKSYDGIQVIRELRRQGIMAPAIILTGYDGVTISKRVCPQNHIHAVLKKADHPEVLINSLNDALNGLREEALA